VLAVVSNILLAGLVFLGSGLIIRVLGKPGTRTVSKLAALLLAAIAVHMIRRGITGTP
jgi:multiple antibiotic resistance protein